MNRRRLLLSMTSVLVLSGCAEMMTATPQLEMKSGSQQKMEVKAKGLRALPIPAQYGLVDIAYSPDGKLLAASGRTGLLGGGIGDVRLALKYSVADAELFASTLETRATDCSPGSSSRASTARRIPTGQGFPLVKTR